MYCLIYVLINYDIGSFISILQVEKPKYREMK